VNIGEIEVFKEYEEGLKGVVKPYVLKFDCRNKVKIGWLEGKV